MEQNHNLLYALRDLEILPPDALREQVMQTYSDACMAQVTEEKATSELGGMADMPVPPPDFLREKIEQHYKAVQSQNRWKAFIRVSLGLAAAVCGVVLFYYWIISNKDQKSAIDPPRELVAKSAERAIVQPVATPDSAISSRTPAGIKKGPIMRYRKFYINGEYAALIDNDLFQTFLNDSSIVFFSETDSAGHLVKLDEYTFFTMSPRFQHCIAEAKETRRNGKPTFKAKLMRRKLEKALRREKQFFDFSQNRTPFDPFDLENLINK